MSELGYFSRRLREARKKNGLSQKALGIKAGIDQFSSSSRMNQYERGKHLPDLLMVEKLAAASNLPVPFFFCPDDSLAELIELWGAMDDDGQRELLALAKNMFSQQRT